MEKSGGSTTRIIRGHEVDDALVGPGQLQALPGGTFHGTGVLAESAQSRRRVPGLLRQAGLLGLPTGHVLAQRLVFADERQVLGDDETDDADEQTPSDGSIEGSHPSEIHLGGGVISKAFHL